MGIKALLMTEDEQFVEPIIKALERRFSLQGVYVCPGPMSALYLGSYHDPDVLFLDDRFGKTTVDGVIGELRLENKPSHYVLLTDDGGQEAMEKALSYGASDYLPRSLGPHQLERCLHSLGSRDDGLVHGAMLSPSRRKSVPLHPPMRQLAIEQGGEIDA